jgi:hypothetical protein
MADPRAGWIAPAFLLLVTVAMAGFVIELRLLEIPVTEPGSGQGGPGAGNGTGAGGPLVQTGGGGGGAGPAAAGVDPGAAAGGGIRAGEMVSTPAPSGFHRPLVGIDTGAGGAGRAGGAAIVEGPAGGGGEGGAGMKGPAAGGGGSGGEFGGTRIHLPEWAALAMAVLAGALAAVGIGQVVRSRLKRPGKGKRRSAKRGAHRRAGMGEEGLRDELSGILGEGLISVEGTADAREAIILSYTRMVAALAAKGVFRDVSATPGEFGRQWSLMLGAPSAAMSGLTTLFEEAVYSVHPLGDMHKNRARRHLLEALEEVNAWKAGTTR